MGSRDSDLGRGREEGQGGLSRLFSFLLRQLRRKDYSIRRRVRLEHPPPFCLKTLVNPIVKLFGLVLDCIVLFAPIKI